MSFYWPYALFALPVILAVLLALFARSSVARRKLLSQFAAARLLPVLLASYSPNLRRLKQALVIAGVLLVVLALARPRWGYEWQEQHARGVDIIFAVDTSKSMLTQDVAPNRLERAKLAIMDLVQKMQGNRVGLVAFAGDAFLQCPLTLDYDAFRQSLEAIDTSTIARGGTDLAAGLNESASALENSGNHKIIVLVTDGEDLQGQGVSTAKGLRDQGVVVFTVGVGTPQGDIIPVPGPNGQMDFVRDDKGNIVKSHLDAATLTAIAQATGGFYQPLGATGEGLSKVYDAGIKPLPEQQLASRTERQALERFQWPLSLGLLLLALDPIIGTRRLFWTQRRAAVATANLPPLPPSGKTAARTANSIVALLLAAACLAFAQRARAQTAPPAPGAPEPIIQTPAPAASVGQTAADSPQTPATPSPSLSSPSGPAQAPAQSASPPPAPSPPSSAEIAEQLYKQGDYKGAAAAYGEVADANPQDPRFRYDQAASLYRSGDYDAAAHTFEQTLSANDLNLQERAYYGMGDSQYRAGQAQMKEDPKKTATTWDTALKSYQNAIDLNPGDADAHYNYNLLKKQLDELKKQLEQQEKQQQQQQQQQNQQNQQDQNQPQNQQNQQQNQQNQQQQQNQQGQQNQNQQNQQNQNQQNQQGQQQQNKPGQQNQNQQNQSGQQNQNQQNQQGQQGQQGQNQQNQSGQQNQQKNGGQQPGHSGAGNPGQTQNQNPGSRQNQPASPQPNQSQNQGQKQNGSPKPNQGSSSQPNQPQNQPGQNGPPKQPQPSPGRQGGQSQGANQKPPNGQGAEPTAAKPGQQANQSGAAAGGAAAAGDQAENGGNGTAAAPGAMTRDEARQVLDSLKNSEHKLPVTSSNDQNAGAQSSPETYQDW